MTLFGTLSPTLTFILKMQTWLEAHTASIAAGFPPRTKEQLNKKWEDLSSATKAKYAKRKKTGVQVQQSGLMVTSQSPRYSEKKIPTSYLQLVKQTLGIISKPENTPLMLQVVPLRNTAYRQLHRTFQQAQIGWLNQTAARELRRRSKKKAV